MRSTSMAKSDMIICLCTSISHIKSALFLGYIMGHIWDDNKRHLVAQEKWIYRNKPLLFTFDIGQRKPCYSLYILLL
jgi:hypothetical protein